jgi:uncharacterized protein YqgC (DUF456 family)
MTAALSVLLIGLLVVFCLLGIVLVPLGLPGTFVICAAALFYGLATGFAEITLKTVILLLGAALFAEGIEALAGIAGAKRYGSGNWAVAASIAGGIAGAVAGAPLFFGAGSIPGALAGAFAAAFAVELLGGKSSGEAFRAGWGTFVGRLAGTIVKGAVAVAMTVICMQRVFS